MKKLTLNRIAGAGIRANRKSYLSLSIGIFASIFLVCAVVLGCFSAYGGFLDNVDRDAGRQDAIVFDYSGAMPDGLTKEWGRSTILGRVDKLIVGFYDDKAADIAYRQMLSGTLPQNSGEIAIELDALDKVAPDAEIGDHISLTVTPLDGEPETREYTLVGIVMPQKELNNAWLNGCFVDVDAYVPEIFVSSNEPSFLTGRQVQNVYLTYGRNTTADHLMSALATDRVLVFDSYGWSYAGGNMIPPDSLWRDFLFNSRGYVIFLILGASLLIFSLIGISSALDSQLERKQQEIAMLRAVGATRKQIRSIFGRESILLACILSPAALAAALAFIWALCRMIPKTLRFYAPLYALVLMLVLSLLFVMAASFLPLWRSSRQPPMGIIRDTAALRKAKRFHSRKEFHPALLVALRKLQLRPMSFLSGTILTALLCLGTLAAILAGSNAIRLLNLTSFPADFQVYRSGWSVFGDLRSPIAATRLTDADLNQIRSLPNVKDLSIRWQSTALMQTAGDSKYLDDYSGYNGNFFFTREDGCAYQLAAELLGNPEKIYYLNIVVTDHPEEFAASICDGAINRSALDSGEEVLFCAPDYYMQESAYGYTISMNEVPGKEYDVYLHNDSMKVGQTITLTQLTADPELPENSWDGDSPEVLNALYHKAEFHQGTTKIGGIVRGLEYFPNVNRYGFTEPVFITTPEGLRSMGLLSSEVEKMSIYLSGMVDEDTESFLENRITRIIRRGNELEIQNNLKLVRQNRESSRNTLLICGSLLAIILWISVSIIAGSSVRQMQGEKKTIGTLRVLGMNGRSLTGSYMGQAGVSIFLGLVLGLGCSVIMMVVSLETDPMAYLMLLWEVAIALLALGLCWLKINRAAKAMLQDSVIDNIREA